jgi:hypothetical protein
MEKLYRGRERTANRPGSQRPDMRKDDRSDYALCWRSAVLRTGTVRGPFLRVPRGFGGTGKIRLRAFY